MTKSIFEEIAKKALKNLPASSGNRIAVCRLIEHAESLTAQLKDLQDSTKLQIVKVKPRSILMIENTQLLHELEVITQRTEELRELVGRLGSSPDEHY